MGPITPDDLRFNRFGLSHQESRVLALAMSGHIDKQIATEMGISLGTVRVYWKRIRQKVGGTRSEVIAELARNSLKLNFDDERERAENLAEELAACQARERSLRVYEAAFTSLPSPLAILDGPVGRIVRANEPFASLHGFTASELEGLPSAALMEPVEIVAFEELARKSADEGLVAESVLRRRRKDGTTFAVRSTLTGDGQNTWVLGIHPSV